MENLKYAINSKEFDNFSKTSNINYIICSTPRSGSTLLSEGLKSTQIAGLPHEYFNVDHKADYLKRWHFQSIEEYIELLKKHRVSDNGIFAFKIHFNQFTEEFPNSNMDKFFKDLKYIFISRNDKVSQGISLEIAVQTNKWSSDFQNDKKALFNFKDIKKRVNDISRQEKGWINYFERNNIKPLVIEYENLEKNYESSIKDVLEFLDLDRNKTIPAMPIKKQRNLKNYLWKHKYNILNLFKS